MAETAGRPKRLAENTRRILRHENAALVIVLIGLTSALSIITRGATITTANVSNVLIQTSTRALAAVGETFVILSGNFDLSVGGIGLMTSILGARLMTLDPEQSLVSQPYSVYVVIPIMLLVGASWGMLNGFITSRIGVSSIITTLGTWQILKGVAFQVSSVAIFELPENLAFFGQENIARVPIPAIILAIVAVIAYFVLHYTGYGRAIYAIGGNRASAWLSGISLRKIVTSVFIVSGFLAALAGVIFTARTMSASFRTLVGLELDSIAAAIIGGVSLTGGKGTIIGALIGALIVGVINNGMSVLNIGGNTAGIVKGAIIIIAVTIDLRRARGR